MTRPSKNAYAEDACNFGKSFFVGDPPQHLQRLFSQVILTDIVVRKHPETKETLKPVSVVEA